METQDQRGRVGPQEDAPRRRYVPDHRKATLGKRTAKWRRWAQEMRAEGWTVIEPSGTIPPDKNDRPGV